jgi:SAM-dependent methyltransferase
MSDLPPGSAGTPSGPDTYALGRSDAETRRLILQHQLYGPFTRQFVTAAGITAGMKVLDVGSGAGDVALLLAELVGPQGQVIGVDTNGEILEVARVRVRAAGWATVVFHAGDVMRLELEGTVDAVVGRWVLQYMPNPAALLRRARRWLRPGGIVAFQEIDLSSPPRAYPTGPLHEQVMRWTTPPPGALGPDPEMGLKLFTTFLQADLPAPQLRRDAPLGGGPTWPGYAYVAETRPKPPSLPPAARPPPAPKTSTSRPSRTASASRSPTRTASNSSQPSSEPGPAPSPSTASPSVGAAAPESSHDPRTPQGRQVIPERLQAPPHESRISLPEDHQVPATAPAVAWAGRPDRRAGRRTPH